MKKKLTFLFVLTFCITGLFSEESWNIGYLGKENEFDLDALISEYEEIFESSVREGGGNAVIINFGKLSKIEKDAIDRKLSEYSLEKDELYFIWGFAQYDSWFDIIGVIVRIKKVYNNGNSFDYSWYPLGRARMVYYH